MSATASVSKEANLVLGMAATAIPFARGPREQAEQWLRLLQLGGGSAAVLDRLGITGEREEGAAATGAEATGGEPAPAQDPEDPVARVLEAATVIARNRQHPSVTTLDVLLAVLDVSGDVFAGVLREHGVDAAAVRAAADATDA